MCLCWVSVSCNENPFHPTVEKTWKNMIMFNPHLISTVTIRSPWVCKVLVTAFAAFIFLFLERAWTKWVRLVRMGSCFAFSWKKTIHSCIANIQLFCRVSEVSSDSTYEEWGLSSHLRDILGSPHQHCRFAHDEPQKIRDLQDGAPQWCLLVYKPL
jgi:hypothetical protein